MALNFQIPDKLKAKNLQTLQKGFGTPIISSLTPSIPNVPLGDFPEGVSIFGTPVYGSLFIERPVYGEPEYDENTKTYQNAAVVLAYNFYLASEFGCLIPNVIVDVNATNNIKKTEIAGQSGSIKEYINQGDLQITIRGFFQNPLPDKHPTINTRMLQSYLKAPVSLNITNSFLNEVFGVTKIAIEGANFFQQEGLRNVQYFRIDAVSDTVVKIKELSK